MHHGTDSVGHSRDVGEAMIAPYRAESALGNVEASCCPDVPNPSRLTGALQCLAGSADDYPDRIMLARHSRA